MKIVAVTPLYPPSSRVGAWLATHSYLRVMVERGHDVSALTVFCDDEYTLDGVNVSGLGWGAADRLKDADVCISHAGDRMGRAAEAARAVGVPHVVMVHGREDVEPDADLVVFNAESSRQDWLTPSTTCRPLTCIEDHRTERGHMVTLVNMSTSKGGQILRRIAARNRDRQFLGVHGGYGSQVRTTEAEHNIRVIRPVFDMRAVWRQTRVLLMPSESETWGMVGVEAMCSGIPVIAHPTPGLQESLGDAGIFVDRNDTYGWCRELAKLDDPEIYNERSTVAFNRATHLATLGDETRFADAIEKLVAQ